GPLPNADVVALDFTGRKQGGNPQTCTPTASLCTVNLSAAAPVALSTSPTSVPQSTGSGTFLVAVDGGPYGGTGNPVVTGVFNGQATAGTAINPNNPDRQLTVTVPAGAASQPGLYQVGVVGSPGFPASVSDIAVQPSFASAPTVTPLTAGDTPSSVAIDTSTGRVVVTNQVS